MKLLIASVDFLPKIGGVSISAHHFANACAAAGVDVTVLCPGTGAAPAGMVQLYRVVSDPNARPECREGPAWAHEERPALEARLERLWHDEKFDCAIAWHPFYYGPALLTVAHRRGCPLSVMIHGFEVRSQLLPAQRWRSFRMRQNGHAPSLSDETIYLLREANQILANSRYTAALAAKAGRSDPAMVIGCGLPRQAQDSEVTGRADPPQNSRTKIRASFGFGTGDFVIGTLCRLVPSKNVSDLIRSLKHMPGVKALIAGDGPQADELKALARLLGVADRVTFCGAVAEAEKSSILAAMDTFCLLSRPGRRGEVEGFGIVMLEAAAAGTPVIAAKAGGMVDVIEPGVTGLLVPPGRPKALAQAVTRIASDKAMARRMTTTLQQRIRQSYNWDQIASRVLNSWSFTDA